MFGDLDWPLNASRGLSAIAEFLVNYCDELYLCLHQLKVLIGFDLIFSMMSVNFLMIPQLHFISFIAGYFH